MPGFSDEKLKGFRNRVVDTIIDQTLKHAGPIYSLVYVVSFDDIKHRNATAMQPMIDFLRGLSYFIRTLGIERGINVVVTHADIKELDTGLFDDESDEDSPQNPEDVKAHEQLMREFKNNDYALRVKYALQEVGCIIDNNVVVSGKKNFGHVRGNEFGFEKWIHQGRDQKEGFSQTSPSLGIHDGPYAAR